MSTLWGNPGQLCCSIFSQWSTNINVSPMTSQSYSNEPDRVMPQVATQSSPNDRPISIFYQCPPNTTQLHQTELFCRLLLNLLPMIGKHQCFTNVIPIPLHWTWQSYSVGCYAIFYQWLANTNVLPLSYLSHPIEPDRATAVLQVVTQASLDDRTT